MNRVLKSFAVVALALAAIPAFAKGDALSLVPNDAVTVGVVHISDMRSSPLSSMLFEQTDKVSSDGEALQFLTEAGLAPTKDIDTLVVATIPRAALGTDADILVAAEGRFNVERLTKALITRGAVQKTGYLMLPGEDRHGAIAFPDAHLVIVGTEKAVTDALANRAAGGTSFLRASGLGRETARIEPNATAWAIVDVTRAQRLGHGPRAASHASDPASVLSSAMKTMSTVAVWATDTGDSLKLGAFGLSSDAETLQLVEDAARGALSAARLAMQEKSPDLVSVLRKFTVSHTDSSVTITGTVPANTIREVMAKQRAEK